jgi:ABC-type lipoprotein release transport system permease subunit
LLGSQHLEQYGNQSVGQGQNNDIPLRNVKVGSVVLLTIGEISREVTVKGIVQASGGNISEGIYMPSAQFLTLTKNNDYSVNEIAVRLKPDEDPVAFKAILVNSGFEDVAKVRTALEALPSDIVEIRGTFGTIGNIISSIGLFVAAITIFIVIFVNALTRRKFIGILKGIGITREAIEVSYIFQSLFYASIGCVMGLVLLYGIALPINIANPIILPLGPVVLYAPVLDTLVRAGILMIATIFAGYIPARMIVKKNTLDSILGRN